MVGERFGRLVVIQRSAIIKNGSKCWDCLCDCGKTTPVPKRRLIDGITKSCGCWRSERARKLLYRHGLYKHRLYTIWSGMKQRCGNPKAHEYSAYGGRGISISKEWYDVKSFYDWALANGYSDDLTIDRIDVNGNYEPNNCRWIPQSEQYKNTQRNK